MWNIVADPGSYPISLNQGTKTKLKSFASMVSNFAADLEKTDAYDLAFRIATETGILKELHNSNSPEELSKYENIQELLNGIREFISSEEQESRFISLGEYLQNVALLTNADNEKDDDKNKVTIMTVHSAKGLEFKYVFVAGVEEELFPSAFSSASMSELEEERRLFYVAITRAKEQVTVSYTNSRFRWGVMNYCKPSRFIKEIDSEYLDWPSDDTDINFIEKEQDSSPFQGFRNRRSPRQAPTPTAKASPPKGKSWKRVYKTAQDSPMPDNFKSSDPSQIQTGMEVEHIRFGKGKVINLEGNHPNIKATVFFHSHGQKQLLLKFAKLKIINSIG